MCYRHTASVQSWSYTIRSDSFWMAPVWTLQALSSNNSNSIVKLTHFERIVYETSLFETCTLTIIIFDAWNVAFCLLASKFILLRSHLNWFLYAFHVICMSVYDEYAWTWKVSGIYVYYLNKSIKHLKFAKCSQKFT